MLSLPSAFVAINKNDNLRIKSSSGAVFYNLAHEVIANNGVVFGAKFDENWNVVHGHAESEKDLDCFLGSKYVQSSLQNEYTNVKKYLLEGRVVLFCGTPCQIAGLKCYLLLPSDVTKNLITVDFICHGVPSPLAWKNYLLSFPEYGRINSISFRDKSEGWINFSLNIDFDDKHYRNTLNKDVYMQGFLKDISLRPSCYECKFKGQENDADISLADFWSVKKYKPEFFDDKGVSQVVIYTEKGYNLWNKVKEGFINDTISFEEAISSNRNAMEPVRRPPKRELFFKSGCSNFKLLKRITRTPITERAEIKIKRFILKMVHRI